MYITKNKSILEDKLNEMKNFLFVFSLGAAFFSFCQANFDGKPQVLTLNNSKGKIIIPSGKKWEIVSLSTSDNVNSECNIVIAIKSLNDVILTDLNNGKIGPYVFITSNSLFGDETILPLYLDENMSIEFLLYEKCSNSNYTTRTMKNNQFTLNYIEFDK